MDAQLVPIKMLKPERPKDAYPKFRYAELRESIRQIGQAVPVRVDAGLVVIDGCARYHALVDLGKEEILAYCEPGMVSAKVCTCDIRKLMRNGHEKSCPEGRKP